MKSIDQGEILENLIRQIVACKDLEQAKSLLLSRLNKTPRIEKALSFCIDAHAGQVRKSGEPYSIHPILVAALVAFFSNDEDMVLAALLHDVIEDTSYSQEEVEELFGQKLGTLVSGLTKIVEIRADNLVSSHSNERLMQSAMTFRHLLLTSILDVRVLVVKLCDRLHNMLTLGALTPDKQLRIAEETMLVYAPIAHRLGISSIKNLLEDLSFSYLMPDEYHQIDAYINSNDLHMQLNLNAFIVRIEELMLVNGFIDGTFRIDKRIKHVYSIFLKKQRKGVSIEEVLDLLGVRITVESVADCYKVLGLLHVHFNPLISRFKDYIALPKQNGYRTIHTTLFDSKAIIEAQIRTFEMHKMAEFGIAAHWKYKLGGNSTVPDMSWISSISLQDAKEIGDDYSEIELYEYAKDSLYVEDIAIYSPKGEIFTLPRGSTALDFAYEIHSEVGLKASDAYVNRIKVPLLTELKSGDIVRIVTDIEANPRCSWIDSVKTARAKAVMRTHCKQKASKINAQASELIVASVFSISLETAREWISKEKLSKKIRKCCTDHIYLSDAINALKKYAKKSWLGDRYELKSHKFESIIVRSNHKIGSIEFDICCNPKRGDEIIAFRRAQSVIVHHKLCERASRMVQEEVQMVYVDWQQAQASEYKLIFSLENKKGALAEFLTSIAKMQINVTTICVSKNQDSLVDYFEMIVEVPANIKIEALKDRLKARYKIYEFISANDAYSN